MRRFSTDRWLWAALFWPALLGVSLVPDPSDPASRSLWKDIAYNISNQGGSNADLTMVCTKAILVVPVALALSWIGQLLGQRVGLRFTARPSSPETIDYDDDEGE